MRLLDLFCGAGGASAGYVRAGFEVVGVDWIDQPRYPYAFHRADALAFPLDGFDVIHASPPCQAYTAARTIRQRAHPDLIGPVRDRLVAHGAPWVIENVPGSPMIEPVELCGAMFGLRTFRHRWFESPAALTAPAHDAHDGRTTKMGRPVGAGTYMQIVGHFSGVELAREIMGTPWMTRDELAQAIPPAYTEHVGRQLLA